MNKIDILACIAESFSSETLSEDIIENNPNSVIVLFGIKKIWIHYKAAEIIIPSPPSYTKIFNNKLDYYFYPLIFLIDQIRLLIFLLKVRRRFFIKTIYVENNFIIIPAIILRKLNLVKKLIYQTGDWLAGGIIKGRIWSHVGNNIVFPVLDYLSCRTSDVVLNLTEEIGKERYKFWRKKITKEEYTFRNSLKIKGEIAFEKKFKRKIAFMGWIRDDSGFEIVCASLKQIRKIFPVSLIFIGSSASENPNLVKLINKNKIGKHVYFSGFVKREELNKIFSECFCGINLITSKNNFSAKAIPAKICDYLQYLLPVVATENIGFMAQEITRNKLGLIIESNKNEFIKAIVKVWSNQLFYRKKIIRYLSSIKKTDINRFLRD